MLHVLLRLVHLGTDADNLDVGCCIETSHIIATQGRTAVIYHDNGNVVNRLAIINKSIKDGIYQRDDDAEKQGTAICEYTPYRFSVTFSKGHCYLQFVCLQFTSLTFTLLHIRYLAHNLAKSGYKEEGKNGKKKENEDVWIGIEKRVSIQCAIYI